MSSASAQSHNFSQALAQNNHTNTRRRRRSSGLPEDPRGDTGTPAVSTMSEKALHASTVTPPSSSASSISAHPQNVSLQQSRTSKRRKARSFFQRWKHLSLRHTWLNPLIVICVILVLYALNPTTTNPLHNAIFLSYPLKSTDPLIPPGAASLLPHESSRSPSFIHNPTFYGKGGLDFVFVGFYMIVLTFTREFIMQRVLRPLALAAQIKNKAKQARYMEQAYTAIYFAVFGPYGLYVMSRSPVWYFNTTAMFEGFPHRAHEGLFKAYYLLQAAYWAQQAVVLLLQLEAPRKDFKELVGHHIITVALIWLSYRFHFTYMGIAVYITHDVSDFFLATSKVLNYLNHPATAPYYCTFILIWAYTRHYLNLGILYATATTFRTVGPFDLNWDTQQYKCWISQYITFALLASLQSVNLFWFFLILRIAYRIAVYSVAKDERSDYGSDDEDGASNDSSETTAEKRKRFGLKPEEGATNGKPAVPTSPTLLVNGETPPGDADAMGGAPAKNTRRRKARAG